jgi:hypothetical protein
MFTDRMKQGGPIIIDNFHSNRSSYSRIIDLAEKNGYKPLLVDFPDISLDELVRRNAGREIYKQIEPSRLKEMYYSFLAAKEEENIIDVVTPEQVVEHIKSPYTDQVIDLNQYEKVHHFGDLQGTYTPVAEYFEQHPFNPNEFYIFLGDYVDRGLENGKAVQFIMDIADKPNVVLLKGNHEIHLSNYGLNLTAYSKIFNEETIPQLQQLNIKRAMIRKNILPYLKDYFLYTYQGKNVFCNHAGLGNIPEYPAMLNPRFYYTGFGGYDYDIDTHFEKKGNHDWYQFHGHRNFMNETFYNPETDINRRSFSLESDVESGGKLSVMQLDSTGFTLVKIKSPLLTLNEKNKAVIKKIKNENVDEIALLDDMRQHEFVEEKTMQSKSYISSFNFTKEAFYQQEYDDISTKARGLFINNRTNEIVARGYDKFFNIGENGIPTAQHDYLKDTMKGHVISFIKENGFLGIQGYDSVDDTLLFASKSTIDSDFAGYFKAIFEQTVSPDDQERIKNDFRKHNLCAVYEVNDPINDPHIIPYEKPHIVLLDIFKRSMQLERIDYDKLKKFGKKYNIRVKEKGPQFKNINDFLNFNQVVANENPLTTKHQFEGYVAEDENGSMIKIKLPYYNYWKQMRGILHRVKKHKETIESKNRRLDKKILSLVSNKGIPKERLDVLLENFEKERLKIDDDIVDNLIERAFFIKDEQTPEAKKFIQHLFDLDEKELSKDIITLRNQYYEKPKKKVKTTPTF